MEKGILITSFGTTHKDTREKTIEVIENIVKEKYGSDRVERAFTSNIVRKNIEKKEGLKIYSHSEGIEALKNKGYKDIITMSLHILEGSEYKTKIDNKNSTITEPLLYNDEDYKRLVQDSELNDLKDYDVLIFMGHGSEDIADKSYKKLQDEYISQGIDNIYVGTVEGEIKLENIIEKIKDKGYKKILLKPFMIVAGEHAKNDMASEEDVSWKTLLENEGYIVNAVLKGMGEHKLVQKMFLEKLEKVILNSPFY